MDKEYKPITERELTAIRNYIVTYIARNSDAMFNEDEANLEDMYLTDVIFALYEALHRAVMHDTYNYMWHWCNKIGAWCDECESLKTIIERGKEI